jgi:hypothetical protein
MQYLQDSYWHKQTYTAREKTSLTKVAPWRTKASDAADFVRSGILPYFCPLTMYGPKKRNPTNPCSNNIS